jgi:hypothetical protein
VCWDSEPAYLNEEGVLSLKSLRGLSTAAAICTAEHGSYALERAFLRQPGRKLRLVASECPSCPGCEYLDVAVVRDGLEAVTQVLPPRARAELRRLLVRLDRGFRRRTMSDSGPKLRWTGEPLPWWHRRIFQR